MGSRKNEFRKEKKVERKVRKKEVTGMKSGTRVGAQREDRAMCERDRAGRGK